MAGRPVPIAFEFIYTPKHGSWLNMAEIELNVLMGQCLNRRIADMEIMKRKCGPGKTIATTSRLRSNGN